MELFFSEVLNFFPKNSQKGLVFGAGIGMISLFIATNFNTEPHLLAHKISGVLSLTYLGLSIIIFTFNHISQSLNIPYKSFSFYYLLILVVVIFLTMCYFLNLTMLKLEDVITLFFTKRIDSFFRCENGESYFVGFIFCYSTICFFLAGFLETTYEALYKIKSNQDTRFDAKLNQNEKEYR